MLAYLKIEHLIDVNLLLIFGYHACTYFHILKVFISKHFSVAIDSSVTRSLTSVFPLRWVTFPFLWRANQLCLVVDRATGTGNVPRLLPLLPRALLVCASLLVTFADMERDALGPDACQTLPSERPRWSYCSRCCSPCH